MKLLLFLNVAFCLFYVAFMDTTPVHNKRLYPNHFPPSSCESMMPLVFIAPPQTSIPPYNVIVFKNRASPGESIVVGVKGRSGQKFRGLYMQARIRGSGVEAVGTFLAENLEKNSAIQISSCGAGSANAVSYNSQDAIDELQLKWQAPANFSGKIYFSATFVQSLSVFWVKVKSQVIDILV